MAEFHGVGSDTVEAYGDKNLPASFVISSEYLDGETEFAFSIHEIGDQRLYVSDRSLSLSNANLVRQELTSEGLNSNLIIEQSSSGGLFTGWEAKFVLSYHAIDNINDSLSPQPNEYCEAVVAFVRSRQERLNNTATCKQRAL